MKLNNGCGIRRGVAGSKGDQFARGSNSCHSSYFIIDMHVIVCTVPLYGGRREGVRFVPILFLASLNTCENSETKENIEAC